MNKMCSWTLEIGNIGYYATDWKLFENIITVTYYTRQMIDIVLRLLRVDDESVQ